MPNKSLFGSASHLANMGSWKAGSPASNPLWLKPQSRQWFIGLQQSHVTTESAINIYCIVRNKSWRRQLRDQTFCFSAWDWFLLQLQRRDGNDASIMQSWWRALLLSGTWSFWWMLGIPRRNSGNRCLRQTCRINLFSAVRHILRTWAAERLAALLPFHGG